MAVAALDRCAPEPVQVGVSRPVDAAAGERGGDESAPDLGFGRIGSRQRLRIGEVGGAGADVLADQFDRPVEFVADHRRAGQVRPGRGSAGV